MPVPRTDEESITTESVSSSDRYGEIRSLSFIFRLPAETLEDIFIQNARDYLSESGSLNHLTPTLPSWVNISYVCRQWRNVALNCAALWTYIFIVSPRWTEELLVRSKDASLKLHVNQDLQGQGFRAPCFVGQVVNHIERIQELRLSLPYVAREDHLFSQLSSPAPRLQILEIWAPNASSGWVLPSVLFNGETPALRILELSYCPVAWYSFKLSGLTTLGLFRVPARFRQNTGDLLATLRCMQNLTRLYLHDALASSAGFLSTAASRTFQNFNLPHLSRLAISAPLSTVIALMSCANIPSKTEIRLDCDHETSSSLDYYALLCSLLEKRFNMSGDQAPSIPTIRSLIFNIWPEAAVLTFSALECHDFDFSVPPPRWGRGIPLQTSVKFGESMIVNKDHIISDICCSITLPNVETVGVIKPPFSSAFWRKVFGHLPNLRYLKLSEGRMPDLASILSFIPRGDMENESGHPGCVLAPVLEVLELENIGFSASSEGLTIGLPASNHDVQSLVDALSSRKESHGQLRVASCPVYYQDFHIGADVRLDMVGRWGNGQFHVVEKSSRPYHGPDSESESESDPESDS